MAHVCFNRNRGPVPRTGVAGPGLPSQQSPRPSAHASRGACHSDATQPNEVYGFMFEKGSLRGAPLRNRTVDLLLTIHTFLGSLPGEHFPQAAGKRRSGSCPGLRHLRSLRPSRLQPSSSWHGSMPSVRSARPRLVCHSSLASGAACRPVTSTPTVKGRSDDLSISPAQDPKTALSRRFLIVRKNLNQCPYLHLA